MADTDDQGPLRYREPTPEELRRREAINQRLSDTLMGEAFADILPSLSDALVMAICCSVRKDGVDGFIDLFMTELRQNVHDEYDKYQSAASEGMVIVRGQNDTVQ